jgi:hypothetical protein
MSIKKMTALGILFVGVCAALFALQSKTSRRPADDGSAKIKFLGKSGQPFQLKIEAVGGVPTNDEQELALKATIEIFQPIPNDELMFKWVLPEGTSVVEGHTEDSLPNIHVGQTATVTITVTGVSEKGIEKHILFNAFYNKDKDVVSNSAVFSNKRDDGPARLPTSDGNNTDAKVDSRSQQKPKIKFSM